MTASVHPIQMTTTDEDDRRARHWLNHADDELLACRAQGHAWPKLRITRGRLSRGVDAVPTREGAYMIVSTCRDCGTRRTLVTKPGGTLDLPAHYSYEYPDGYRAPKGTHVGRREALAEVWSRSLGVIRSHG